MEVKNELAVFNFNGQNQVRTIVQNGEPWFVAKDICDILELGNVSQALSTLDSDEKMTITNNDSHSGERGGAQSYLAVNESGLYTLVFKSRKPQAQAFRKWVTSEVLPIIRKTGQYSQSQQVMSNLLPNEFTSREFAALHSIAITAGLEGNAAIVSADNAMKRLHNVSPLKLLQIELKNPDQQYLLTPTQIAERLKLSGPREVNRLLAAKNFQTKEGKIWIPTQKGKPFATLLDTGKRHSDGTMVQQLKWRESVLDELRTLTDLDD